MFSQKIDASILQTLARPFFALFNQCQSRGQSLPKKTTMITSTAVDLSQLDLTTPNLGKAKKKFVYCDDSVVMFFDKQDREPILIVDEASSSSVRLWPCIIHRQGLLLIEASSEGQSRGLQVSLTPLFFLFRHSFFSTIT